MRFVTILLCILLILLQYRLWIGNGSLTEVHHLERVKQQRIMENQQLKDRNQTIAAEVHDLKQGYDAIEERARSELGMIKNDETFYQIVSENPYVDEKNQE
jgi:cell division protein FtsB